MLYPVYEIRIVGADDWAVWRVVRLAALTEAPNAFGSTLLQWQGEGDSEERWRDRLSIPGARDLLAFRDGGAVGMLSGVPDQAAHDRVWLISMWVAPTDRGSTLSDQLIEDIVGWAGATGRTSVNLMVRQNNVTAIKLYRRCGFVETGFQETEVDASGTAWCEIEMTRPVDTQPH
jgi:ribosomal protein S18 acetylase RimI-like enzyme